MGTNYYWIDEKEDRRHVGKASAGWSFSFHAIPHDGIKSYSDWKPRLGRPGTHIEDEYGERIDAEAFEKLVEEKRGGLNHARLDRGTGLTLREREYMREHPNDFGRGDSRVRLPAGKTWVDPEGHSFSAWEFV